MSEKKFTARAGDEIIISVPRKNKTATEPSVTPSPSKKGALLRVRPPDEHLPRRLQKGDINFYDLGYVKNPETGEYENLDWTYVPSVAGTFGGIVVGEMTYLKSLERDELFFEIPFDQWKTRFKRFDTDARNKYHPSVVVVEDAENGAVAVIDYDSDQWSNNGLKLTDAQLNAPMIYVSGGGGFAPTAFAFSYIAISKDINAPFKDKVTATHDYYADEVDLDLTGKMDVFLVPALIKSDARGEATVGNQNTEFLLNQNFNVFPREILLDVENEFYAFDLTVQFYSATFSADENNGGGLVNYNEAVRAANFHKSLKGARLLKRIWTGSGSNSDAPFSNVPLDQYPPVEAPHPPTAQSDAANASFILNTYVSVDYQTTGGGTGYIGFLVAVILKNASVYYVWRSLD